MLKSDARSPRPARAFAGAHQPAFVAPDPKTPDVLKPVCNNKRCPGKTCEGEKAGRSWYAGQSGAGVFAPVWRAFRAYCAGKKVALADLVDMGVRELDGRDPTTQVLVTREDLLRYEGSIGPCESCKKRSKEGLEKHKQAIKNRTADQLVRGHRCTVCGNRKADGKNTGKGSEPPCDACAAKRAAKAAAS